MADIPGFGPEPIRYELRLQGHLDQHWSNWFTGLTLTQNQDGTTSLCGTLADQAALHGLLAKVRDLGATLLSVTSVKDSAYRHETEADENRGDQATVESGKPSESATALEAEAVHPGNPPHTHAGGWS
jgi:hypothetical protein